MRFRRCPAPCCLRAALAGNIATADMIRLQVPVPVADGADIDAERLDNRAIVGNVNAALGLRTGRLSRWRVHAGFKSAAR